MKRLLCLLLALSALLCGCQIQTVPADTAAPATLPAETLPPETTVPEETVPETTVTETTEPPVESETTEPLENGD